MKRRRLLQLLSLIPTAFLAAACKDKLPSTPTIVTGKIIDENGLPLEGAGLRLTGVRDQGFSPVPTFSITIESDKDGNYKLSQLVPENTDQISIASRTTPTIVIDNQNYAVYIFEKGRYQLETSPFFIPRSDWGKTTTINYQFIKQ